MGCALLIGSIPSLGDQFLIVLLEFHRFTLVHLILLRLKWRTLSFIIPSYVGKLIATKSELGVFITLSLEAIRFGQFMRLNPPTFQGVMVEEYPQGFLDEMEKIFCVMHAIYGGRV